MCFRGAGFYSPPDVGEMDMWAKNIKKMYTALLVLSVFVFAGAAQAESVLQGEKQVLLLGNKGESIVIGSIKFMPEVEGARYELHMDHSKFKDFFLSMKEMKCLEGPELWCHLSYPYEQPHTVTEGDMSWLSHDLLFMFKKKKDFGANFWNGIYYNLRIEDGIIRGDAQAVDLNLLASPPDDLAVPPVGEAERDDLDPSKRWLPVIEIR
jgi:hypothetical protein